MPRYAKAAALDLINFAKKLSIRANYFDRTSGSAFEFARQMGSPHLLKKNPGFEFSFVIDEESARPASLRAEFINGQVWEVETGEMHCSELRSEFFQICEDIEDEYDKTGEVTPGGGDAPKAAGKGKK